MREGRGEVIGIERGERRNRGATVVQREGKSEETFL